MLTAKAQRIYLTVLASLVSIAILLVGAYIYHHRHTTPRPTPVQKVSSFHDVPSGTPATIFQVSETVQPGDTMNVAGSGFSLSATTWLQLVKSDGTLDASQKRQLVIANQSSYLIQAVVPSDMPAGLWAVWVQNGSTSSNLRYVHQARATGYDFNEVAPGGQLRIWGRSLVATGGDYHTAYVTFTSNGTTVTAPATAAEAYSMTITVPASLVPGTVYTVKVSNGLGGSAGESASTQPLTIRSGGPDVFNLGVPWAADFTFSSNQYNVKTDGRLSLHATGDGTTDDLPAIQAAATYAHTHGGGVVYLPAGTYYLDNTASQLSIDSMTVIEGAGPGSTTLTYGKNAGSDPENAFVFQNVSEVGILNLTLQNLNNRSTKNGSTDNNETSTTPTSEVFIKNIVWQMGNQTKPIQGFYDKFLIANSTFSTTTVGYSPIYFNHISDTTIENNTFLYGTGRLYTHGNNLVIENNTISVDGNLNNPNVTETGALELSFSSNVAVRGNSIQVTGTVDHTTNDLEMILTQNAEENLTILGTTSSATATSLVDTTKDWSSTTAFDSYPVPANPQNNKYTPIVAIISGTGMGQWRSITAHDLHSVTLDHPWDITPDTTSGYVITWWTADRLLIENNTVQNGSEGVDLYTGANDSVIAGNTITNSGGIGIYSIEFHGEYPANTPPLYDSHYLAWNNLISNNTVTNTNGLVAAKIWIQLNESDNTNSRGNSLLGNEVRNNSLTAHNPNTQDYPWRDSEGNNEGYYDGIIYSGTNPDPGMLGVIGTIWENNAAQNVSAAPKLNLGSSQMTVHYAGQPASSPCLNLLLASRTAGNYSTSGVQLKYFLAGTTTLVARTENWPSQMSGSVTMNDPNLNALLSDSATYDVWVKAPGFLARKITGVTHVLSSCTAMSQSLIAGDFQGDNTINISDIVSAIRAFNLVTDASAQLANQTFGHTVAFVDLITLIRNYQQNPTGDPTN